MRFSGLLAAFAVCTTLFAAGCGGGGGNNTRSVNGVWTGAARPTVPNGSNSALQTQFVQIGTQITGTAVTTNASGSSIGTITGTIHGDQITATITTRIAPANPTAAQRTEGIHDLSYRCLLPGAYSASAGNGPAISGASRDSTGNSGTFKIAPSAVHTASQSVR